MNKGKRDGSKIHRKGADCVTKEGKCNPKINKEVRANGIDFTSLSHYLYPQHPHPKVHKQINEA